MRFENFPDITPNTEIIWWTLWHRKLITENHTDFFDSADQNMTNMDIPCQLPSPQTFLVHEVVVSGPLNFLIRASVNFDIMSKVYASFACRSFLVAGISHEGEKLPYEKLKSLSPKDFQWSASIPISTPLYISSGMYFRLRVNSATKQICEATVSLIGQKTRPVQ